MNKDLLNEIEISHMIYIKNRAQQRNQRWWRYVSMSHRRLIRCVQHNKVDPVTAEFLTTKLIPQVARSLHTVLAQGAFITSGFASLACTARIYTSLVPAAEKKAAEKKVKVKKQKAQSSTQFVAADIDMDLGTEIDPNDVKITHKKTVEKEAPKKKKEKKSKKKSSARSAIDDIFG